MRGNYNNQKRKTSRNEKSTTGGRYKWSRETFLNTGDKLGLSIRSKEEKGRGEQVVVNNTSGVRMRTETRSVKEDFLPKSRRIV